MKKITTFFAMIICAVVVMANPVEPEQASTVALHFMMRQMPAVTRSTECTLAYTKSNDRSDALFYVYNVGGGFVIVAADDAVTPVLGYSTTGSFDPQNIPANCAAWLQGYADQIALVKQHHLSAPAEVSTAWTELVEGREPVRIGNTRSVAPLLTTTWSQDEWYNALCPGTGNSQAVTGCVATAMAQIINYHQWPAQGFGTHSYNSNTYGILQADFGNTTYHYDLMPDYLDENSTPEQVNAVATLMRDCGIAVEMDYQAGMSGAHDIDARAALVNYFGYHAEIAERDLRIHNETAGTWSSSLNYSDNAWKNLLKRELDAHNPIFYSGMPYRYTQDMSGHALVCDGYDANDYFHFNWGWGGSSDGYYAVGDVIPAGADTLPWAWENVAIFCRPNSSGTPQYLLGGFDENSSSSMTVSGTLDISHLLGFNEDYKVFSYGWEDATLILYPQSADGQLLLEKLAYNVNAVYGLTIHVYDGVGTDGTLLMTVDGSEEVAPVFSTAGALTLVSEGTSSVTAELLLRISEVNCLPFVNGFTCVRKSFSTADFEWNIVGAEEWTEHDFNFQIEYGPHGFTPGTGTTVAASSTSLTIGGLTNDTEYDAYLTYTCTDGVQTLGPVTFQTEEVMVSCFEEPIVPATGWNENPFAFCIGYGTTFHQSQQIYTAAELAAMGLHAGDEISSLAVQFVSDTYQPNERRRNIAIYMGNTPRTTFEDITDIFALENLVNVYTEKEHIYVHLTAMEWHEFEFDNLFVWDGHSNVVVAFADSGQVLANYALIATNIGVEYNTFYTTRAYDRLLEDYRTEYVLTDERASIRLCLATRCPKPTHLTSTYVNRHSVQIEWLPGYQETTWNVEYGPAGFEQGTGTSRTIDGEPQLILTQLTSEPYDIYVQADCGDATSQWVKYTFFVGDYDCVQIGELPNENYYQSMPFIHYSSSGYSFSEQMFTAEELSEQGLHNGDNIVSISLDCQSRVPRTISNVCIYLCQTTDTYFSRWKQASEMQLVFSGDVEISNGPSTIYFDAPFTWNDTSNLVVAIWDNSGELYSGPGFASHPSSLQSLCTYSATPIDTIRLYTHNVSSGNYVSYRNNIRFCKNDLCVLQRDINLSIVEGATYNFYGTPITEPGTYYRRWFVNDECDSLVVLHLSVRKVFFVTPNGSGSHDGSSWANAMQLQEAMDTCSYFIDRTPCLYVKKGTYTGNVEAENSFEIKPNVHAYGGFVGNEPADYDLSNRTQANMDQTILFGSNARRVLYQNTDFTPFNSTLFDGFTIRGGTASTNYNGGGAYIRKNCTLNNCKITANTAEITSDIPNSTAYYGIGVYSNGGTLTNCEIYNNTVNLSGTGSGYTVNGVGVYMTNNGVVENCNIHENTAINSTGNNWNVYGGGVACIETSTISHCTVTQNSATLGGGISCRDHSTITNCIISNNIARAAGGAVTIGYGGAVFTQCLISNNAAGSSGGGVNNAGTPTQFIACDIVRNSAVTSGAGLYTNNDIFVYNSIVWGNKVGANDNQLAANTGRYYTFENSAVQGGYSGAITLEADNTGTGVGYPHFTSPTTEAGVDVYNAIGDWTLQPGSICANLGRNYYVNTHSLNTDLGGNTRIQQGRADIGCYESAHEMAFPIHPETEHNIIYVTTTGAGMQDGSSWDNATDNLQYAMDMAMGCNPPAAVWVAEGTYTPGRPLITQPKVAVYGGFEGIEPNTFDISQRDLEEHTTIIDGDSTYRVLDKSRPFDTPGESLFDGLTFQNGFVSGTSDYAGAYLYANTDLLNCTFSNNHRNGVYATDCHIDNCVFDSNKGTGLYTAGATDVNNCTAQNNTNYGIYFTSTGTLTNSMMKENNTSGLYITNGKVDGCTIQNNGASNYGVNSRGTNIQFSNTSIINNLGGGLYAEGGFYVNVNIANNTKTRTGTSSNAVYAGVHARSNARFINCNIVNNKVELVPSYVGGSVNYTNAYAGIFNYSTNNEYTNCIVWGNRADTLVSNLQGEGTFSYCAVEEGVDGIANITLESDNAGETEEANYVNFVRPSDEAGITSQDTVDYHLAAGSACINAGNSNNTSLQLPTYDLGGSLRIKQQRVDIGVYESGDVTTQHIDDEVCLGESYFYGNYFVFPEEIGLHTDTFIYYQGGNDYIAYINLQVNPVYNINIDTAICAGESYYFNGQTYTTSTTATASFLTAKGCDSTVVLNLTVNPSLYGEFSAVACDSYIWNGIPYYESGDYEQTLQAETGCDSIVTLHLTVHHSVETVDSMTLCRAMLPFVYRNVIINENAPEHDTIPFILATSHGCDSTVYMRFTIVDVITTEFSAEACDLYVWNDEPYTTSGDKVQTFVSSTGCDSIVTLHLTIYNTNEFETEAEACYSYLWNDHTYTESGDYQQVLTNAEGCDSIVILHLTIHQATTSEFTDEGCDSYVWNNQTYEESGDYQQTFTNAAGCDSIVTLHLTIYPTYQTQLEETICQGNLPYHYTNGLIDTTFDENTPELSIFNFHFSTSHGCDSTVILTFHVTPVTTPQLVVDGIITACQSSSATLSVDGNYTSFNWSTGATTPTIEVTTPGYYWVELTDINGCYSISEVEHLGISELIPETPAICMVGVENGHNLIVWEEIENTNVQNYRIYRENDQADVYELLATVPASQGNSYEDVTADPTVRAWRYKVTAMDVCQGETPMSELHKTVHLTINQGIGNTWNLIWTHYEGMEFASYRLYRGTTNADLQPIATLPATLTSYTDYDNVDGALFYQIEVVMNGTCLRRSETYTGARSNIVYNGEMVYTDTTVSECQLYEWFGTIYTQSGDYQHVYTSELGYDCTATLHLTIFTMPSISISGNTDVLLGESTTLSVTSNPQWTYLWSTGATTSSITVTPEEPTTYSVTVTNGTCEAEASVDVSIHDGIPSYDNNLLTLYPNPTNDIVNVQFTMNNGQWENAEIRVYDVYGRLLHTVPAGEQTVQIDLSHYATGVYLIQLVNNGNVMAVRKVVKE